MKIRIFVLLSLLFSGGIAFGETVLPKEQKTSATSVEFVAYEDKKVQEERSVLQRFRLILGGGVGFPAMDELNDYVDYINNNFSGSVDTIDTYYRFVVQAEYKVIKDVAVGIGYERIRVDTDGTTWFLGVSNRFSIDLAVDGIELYLRKTWPVAKALSIETLAGAGYYFSDYTEKENGYNVSGDDESIGLRAGVGLHWAFTKHMGVHLDAAYRWLKFDRYEDGGTRIRFVSPGTPPAEADFSGFMLNAGLTWRF